MVLPQLGQASVFIVWQGRNLHEPSFGSLQITENDYWFGRIRRIGRPMQMKPEGAVSVTEIGMSRYWWSADRQSLEISSVGETENLSDGADGDRCRQGLYRVSACTRSVSCLSFRKTRCKVFSPVYAENHGCDAEE
ncbi:MAG: hypothetical protein OEY28_04225 [Nitrospira sp.]|nr:hypothetical protein [Nitrospira sp.]